MRAGIFGGTFNPPHKGHCQALKHFIRSAKLDRVYVIPTFIPPHKSLPEKWAGFDDRMEMCRIAFSDASTLCDTVFSGIEKQLFETTGEKSYTYRTVQTLYTPEDTLCLYVGTDMFLSLNRWKECDYLLSHLEIWVMPRGDGNDGNIYAFKEKLEKQFPDCRISVIDEIPVDASSTEIRSGDFSLLDEGVRKYIVEKGLYQ